MRPQKLHHKGHEGRKGDPIKKLIRQVFGSKSLEYPQHLIFLVPFVPLVVNEFLYFFHP